MRFLIKALAVALFAYLLVLAYFVIKQRDFIYYPADVPLDAKSLGIDGLEQVTLSTEDGETLSAFYLTPTRENAPVFLYFDGNGSHIGLWAGRWQRIADAGAGVLAVSYRGYPGSTGSPSEQGLYADSDAAWTWLTARHAPEDIVIHGFSLGSGVASRLGSLHNSRAVVLEAPYTALDDRAAEAMPFLPVKLLIRDRYRSRDRIADIKQPVLIVHAEGDGVISIDHGRTLASLAGDNAKFIAMPGGDHTTATRDGLYPMIWSFLDYSPDS